MILIGLHSCAHSLLTIGEALSCNYGNQRWVKITLHFYSEDGGHNSKLCQPGYEFTIHNYKPTSYQVLYNNIDECSLTASTPT